jgi:2EXR family
MDLRKISNVEVSGDDSDVDDSGPEESPINPQNMTRSFHHFSRLPTEIRFTIWGIIIDKPKIIVVLFDCHPRVVPPSPLRPFEAIDYDFTVRILGFTLQ